MPRFFPAHSAVPHLTRKGTFLENDLHAIAAELAQRFPHSTGFTKPIQQKLARAIYRRERCEALLKLARKALHSPSWRKANPQQQSEFLLNLRNTEKQAAELSGLIHRLTAVLVQNENCFLNTN
jgi:hypothetical protein